MESQAQNSHLALDIGGSLIKLVYFSQNSDCGIEGGKHTGASANEKSAIKATGGGSYKFADLFKEKLGICLGKEDEMDSLVAGANFLLKSVRDEAFTYMDGQKEFQQIDQDELYPYLLVNIGSGVSMIKVDGPGKFHFVGGTIIGGGTFWGLGRLLTRCKSFDELLELSNRGDNRAMGVLVGDIYGGTDYKKISYLNALRFGIKRIFFAGYFLQGHASAMDSITVAVHFWSKGEVKAMFSRHDGFVGALGAFMSYEKHGFDSLMVHQLEQQLPIGSSNGGDKTHGPADSELNDNPSIGCSIYLS